MSTGIISISPDTAAKQFAKSWIRKGYVFESLYIYFDALGQIIYWRIRYKHPVTKEKWIRPMHLGADGKYYLAEPPEFKNKPKPLYGLHLLTKYPQAMVWIVEGEKCADALNQFFDAQSIISQHITVTSGSATSENKADWTPLQGRECHIWPDNASEGIAYGAAVATIVGCSVIINATALGLSEGGDCADWLEAHPAATLDDLLALPIIAPMPEATSTNLPVIFVQGGGLSNEATKGEAALIDAGTQIYQRGATLVRPVIEEVDAAKGRCTKVAQLVRITQPYLIDKLCQVAQWEKCSQQSDEPYQINPPPAVAKIILDRYGEWKFPAAAGVITTPTLRPDGTLLINAGYDPATRLILFEPPPMPDIPEEPTRKDAEQALMLLDGLLDEFPFVDGASRSTALSALITPVVRGAFPVVPMHVARAPTPGSGKSFLLDIASAIATGRLCPVMAAGRNEEETEKRLGAALIAGQPIISIDNVNGDLGGDALCQTIERPLVEIRILGKSERVRVEARSTIFATGNNIRLLGDMTRRVIICTLDAKLERPELRQFRDDPFTTVIVDRGKYIAAALIVVRAYIVAGRPNPAPRLASFEGWSDTVRSALMWLGKDDPVKTMESAREDDPYLQAMTSVFTAMRAAIGCNKPETAADIVRIACEREEGKEDGPYKHPDLRDALMNVGATRTGFIVTKELGKWLGRHKGCIACGLRLEGKSDGHGHAASWWLIDCGSSG